MKTPTKTKIRRSMRAEKQLTYFGLGIPSSTKFGERARKFREDRKELLRCEETFEAACQWLEDVDKTDCINTNNNSYFLKHIAERCCDVGHISNGVLIAAAIHCGFSYKTTNNHPNVFFNMDPNSIQKKYELSEMKLTKKYAALSHS